MKTLKCFVVVTLYVQAQIAKQIEEIIHPAPIEITE